MPLKNTPERYGLVAIGFHWLMALLVIGMLAIGLYMENAERTPNTIRLYGLHKSLGMVVLALVTVRLIWRFTNVVPILPASMRNVEKLLAHGAHYLLYACMFAMPFSGWLMSSAAGFPVSVFGWITLPNLIAPDKELRKFFAEAHELIAYGMMALIAAHISAALLHQFRHKDNVLRRMLPVMLMFAALPAHAEETPRLWKIVPEESSLTFTATQNNAPVTGGFTAFSGEIYFAPDTVEAAHVKITVQMESVTADYEEVAATLKTFDWFDAGFSPEAVFEARKFTRTGEKDYEAEGTLTIRSVTVPVKLAFTLESYGADKAVAKGHTTLLRNDFGIGRGSWAATDSIKNEVRVDFTLHAIR